MICLTGVVDWTRGSWGPAAVGTAHLLWNLVVDYGHEAADQFLDHYRKLSGGPARDQHYWDVVTLLDVIPDLDPDVPPSWDCGRVERYLEDVL